MPCSARSSVDDNDTQESSSCCLVLRRIRHVVLCAFACACLRSDKASPRVLPYDNTRDQNVSLRELYGQTHEQEGVLVTWVTGEASSETSSTLSTLSHAGPSTAINRRTAALQEEPSGLSFCSQKYGQQGGLAKLHASNLGHAIIPQLSQDEQPADRIPATEGTEEQHVAQLWQQVNILQHDKGVLQEEAAGLHRQLTWLQSHASLQDGVNQDLMAEVLHLREALAALSALPPQSSQTRVGCVNVVHKQLAHHD